MSDQNLPDQNKSNQNMNAQAETESDQIAPDDATINGNLCVTKTVSIGICNTDAKLHISDPSFRGNIKLSTTSGLGHDFGYDGGVDNFFAFAHYGLESGQTKFVWHQNEAATRDLLTIENTGNIVIGTVANPSPKKTQLHVEGKLIYSGGSLGGLSFGDRSISGFVENPTQGERWTWFADKKTAQLWSGRTKLIVEANGDLKAEGDIYAKGVKLQSSRELKENIAELSGKEAVEALKNLNPVKFNFKADSDKNLHIGFIAEDVPELVATSDRKTLSPMDIVAVLTQALKEQQNTISVLAEKVKLLEAKTA